MEDGELLRRIDRAARELVGAAQEHGVTVATAESCTAGLVAARIADVAGASEVLRGGAVTYCDEVKHEVLGVDAGILEQFSAVSEPCARAMAEGARALFKVDAAVSLTGYAGPGGGTERDPAGTVYIGLSSAAGSACRRCTYEGSRNEVRDKACLTALEMLFAWCRAV